MKINIENTLFFSKIKKKICWSIGDERDKPFLTGERTVEGYYKTNAGLEQSISRGLAYAPYADMIWCETSTPDLEFAKKFAESIKKEFPNKMLAYNWWVDLMNLLKKINSVLLIFFSNLPFSSPSFNWKLNLSETTIAKFQKELGAMGYKFQFITLAGFHALNMSMFELAHGYARTGMPAFVELQEKEFAAVSKGFTAIRHQREVGTGYFDQVLETVNKHSSISAWKGSTEDEQFRAFESEVLNSKDSTLKKQI